METTPLRTRILDTIIRKSNLKQKVFDNTFAAFNLLKETLLEIAAEMDDELDGKLDRRVRLEYRLPLNEINYVEISAHNIIFHTTEGPVQSYGTLKDVSCELDGKGFALCNRCYLVNLRRVKYIDGYTVKVGDEELQISRPQKKSFAEAFKKFIRTVRDE